MCNITGPVEVCNKCVLHPEKDGLRFISEYVKNVHLTSITLTFEEQFTSRISSVKVHYKEHICLVLIHWVQLLDVQCQHLEGWVLIPLAMLGNILPLGTYKVKRDISD